MNVKRYIKNDWQKRNYRQKYSLVGLGLVVAFIFIVNPLFEIIGGWNSGILWAGCQDNVFNCYTMGALTGLTLGSPIIIAIMVVAYFIGRRMDKKAK